MTSLVLEGLLSFYTDCCGYDLVVGETFVRDAMAETDGLKWNQDNVGMVGGTGKPIANVRLTIEILEG